MATDVYLQIDGIKGESQDDKHKDWIEVTGIHWASTNLGAPRLRPEAVTLPSALSYRTFRSPSWLTCPHRS